MPDRVPGFGSAVIPHEKVAGYLLDPGHPEGRHKARVLASALDYGPHDAERLTAELRAGLAAHAPHARRVGRDSGAILFTVDMTISGPNGRRANLRTAWQVDAPGAAPRFISARVRTPKGGQAAPGA